MSSVRWNRTHIKLMLINNTPSCTYTATPPRIWIKNSLVKSCEKSHSTSFSHDPKNAVSALMFSLMCNITAQRAQKNSTRYFVINHIFIDTSTDRFVVLNVASETLKQIVPCNCVKFIVSDVLAEVVKVFYYFVFPRFMSLYWDWCCCCCTMYPCYVLSLND